MVRRVLAEIHAMARRRVSVAVPALWGVLALSAAWVPTPGFAQASC